MSNSKPTHSVIYKSHQFTGDDGKPHNGYSTIGAAWCSEDGTTIRLDTLPITWDGVMYLRTRDEKAT